MSGHLIQQFRYRWLKRLHPRIIYFSTVSCPHCGKSSRDQMPSNACVYFYHCLRCDRIFKPLPGDCCVYCSYGDVPCPPKQMEWTGKQWTTEE